MSTGENAVSLAAEFPDPNRRQWLQGVAGALKIDSAIVDGDDPESTLARLRSKTYDGVVVEPLYTADDADADDDGAGSIGLPGFAPFVRGRTAAGARAENWDVRQLVDARSDVSATGELERGATSLWIDLRNASVIDVDSLVRLLDGVLLDVAPIVLDAGPRWRVAAEALVALWTRRGVAAADALGAFGADPLGEHASGGGTDVADAIAELVEWTTTSMASSPAVRTIVVDATRYHDAGASDGQELAYAIAAGVVYLRSLVDAGCQLGQAFGQIELRVAATADQFGTIAKIRALRRLWSRIAEVGGNAQAAGATTIHAVTSRAMMTQYDPWVNLLRTTVACFSAGVAGADAITVLPYDDLAGDSELGRRLSRNTQSVLAMESNLARVVDPGGGSWYLEQLTADVAAAAWADFQEVEAAGGFVAAVDAGLVLARIEASWAARTANLATKRDAITGVSEFPNIDEVIVADADGETAPSAGGLPRRRYAEQFESLRHRVDRASVASGARPSVFLAALGDAAAATARLTYAKNLFETAGIVTIPGPTSTTIDEIADAFAAAPTAIGCLCSSDAIYAEHAVDAAQRLKAAGATHLYLAGRPRDLIDQLTAAGIDRLIYTGCDVRGTLAELLTFLGVP